MNIVGHFERWPSVMSFRNPLANSFDIYGQFLQVGLSLAIRALERGAAYRHDCGTG